jgi:hypothetical protein
MDLGVWRSLQIFNVQRYSFLKIEFYTAELIEGTKVEVILLDSLIMQRQILYIVEFLDGEIQGQYHS